uniref:J domain-containing protein n=1 Tax=Caenorhabditis tropicalis TaxID=1561998 RepID=A0A1I7TV53_9PELO
MSSKTWNLLLSCVAIKSHKRKTASYSKIFSRSSSPADDMVDTEEEETQRTRSASNHAHQNGSGQLKKDQKKRAVQPIQRRRKGRKDEPTWLQKTWDSSVDFFWFAWGHICFALQWTFILIVEVCQKIADIFITSGKNFWDGTCKGVQSIFLAIVSVFLCGFNNVVDVLYRSLTFISMIGVEECETLEELNWGCKKELPIATNASEYADRLSRETIRDAYSVFGLKSDCSDDDIKRNYKRLAALVSPDKCNIDAVDDIFELVNVAFAAIGLKESRSSYTVENSKVNEAHQKVIASWNKMAKAVEDARNTIFCDCIGTHYRVATTIQTSQARTCKRCSTKHPAKQNDIWVEKSFFGLYTTYYTCTDNVVYDITSWATCAKNENPPQLSDDNCQWTREQQNKRKNKNK